MKHQIIIYLTILSGFLSCDNTKSSNEEPISNKSENQQKSANNDIKIVPSKMTQIDATHYRIEWKNDSSQKLNYFVQVKTDKTTKIYPQKGNENFLIINTKEKNPIGTVYSCPGCKKYIDPTAMEVDIDIIAFGSGFDMTGLKSQYDVLNLTPIQTSDDLNNFLATTPVACNDPENIHINYYLNMHKNPDLMYFDSAQDFDLSKILIPRTTSTPLDKLYSYTDATHNSKVNHDLTVQNIISNFFSSNVQMNSDIYVIRRKKCN